MLRCARSPAARRLDHAGVRRAYGRLHQLGWAHSFECCDDDGELVGGLYGVRIGGFFAGESMFHRRDRRVEGRARRRSSSGCDETGGRCSTCSGRRRT